MDCDNLNETENVVCMWYVVRLLLSDHKGVETSTGPEKD